MTNKNAKNKLLKHLARAHIYATERAINDATDNEERDAIVRIARAIGIKRTEDGESGKND